MTSDHSSLELSTAEKEAIQEFVLWAFIRFGVKPETSMACSIPWLKVNPAESWQSLHKLLMECKVFFKNGALLDLRQISSGRVQELVALLQGTSGVDIKDRVYRAKTYHNCFIGSEAVHCLQHRCEASRPEAVRLGELLVENKVIRHVVDEHGFKDQYLFYRFCEYENSESQDGSGLLESR